MLVVALRFMEPAADMSVTCRRSWVQGCVLAKAQLAYSQPTEQGLLLFRQYSGSSRISMYTA